MTINLKRLAKNVLFSCLAVSSLSFFGCKTHADIKQINTEPTDSEHYATVCIIVENNEFQSQIDNNSVSNTSILSARTATPVLPNKITYSLTASGTELGKTTTSSKSSDSSAQTGDNFTAEKKYMIKLPAGTWTVTVTGKNSNNQNILKGTSETFTVAADGYYEETVPVYFISAGETTNKGKINLVIETTDTNISYLKITGTSNTDLDKKYNVTTDGTKSIIKIYLSSNSIASGNYYPTLTFYNNENSIVTIIKETFNIRNYMETNTWFKTGNALYLKEKENTTNGEADFILTQEIIDTLENNTIYVKGSYARSSLIKNSGSDSNDGTRVAPYATLGAALKRINELNNINYDANNEDSSISRKTFTIYCDGNIGGETSASEITLAPSHPLTLTIQSIDSEDPASISSPKLTFGGNLSYNVTIKDLTFKGDIALNNGNVVLESVPVQTFSDNTKGTLTYSGGQLTIGGTTCFKQGITLKAANKKILVDSAITASSQTKISADSAIAAGYTESSVILEGSGSNNETGTYPNLTVDDLSKFIWVNQVAITGNADYFALRLKSVDEKVKIILGKTSLAASDLPVHNDISFVLEDFDSTGSNTESIPPKYEYKINGYGSSVDRITGNITIKMYVKKGTSKLKIGNNDTVTLDSLGLAFYGDGEVPISSQQISTDTSDSEYTTIELNASGIRPGVYSLKMSAIIDGIPYSQQSAAIYASLGAS